MLTVEQIAETIIEHEGGWQMDSSDPGNLLDGKLYGTNFGITIRVAKELGLDLNRDGIVDNDDMRLITIERATDIFIDQYFYGRKLDLLPDILQPQVFDFAVNSGGAAVKVVQRLTNRINGSNIRVDGAMGRNTAAAVNKAYKKIGDDINDAYVLARVNWYYALGDKRPRLRKYCTTRKGRPGGWITRACSFLLDPSYNITQEQHEARTARWQ